MEKQLNIPKLRFPKFLGEWEMKKLDEITEKINSGKTPLGGESVYVDEGIMFIRSQNVLDSLLSFENSTYITDTINNTMKNSVVMPNDILLNITGASLGRSCVVPNDFTIGNVNQHVCIVRIDKFNEPGFIQPIFASEKGQNIFACLQTGSGREGLNFQSIKGIEIHLPSLPEQSKISKFLKVVDDKLNYQSKKKSLLEKYKNGVMQEIFSQNFRFKENDGSDFPDWNEMSLNEILVEHRRRNKNEEIKEVFSVAKTKGVINQIEHLGRSYASLDTSNYKAVFPNDVIYTKSPTSDFPFGIIKQNKLDRTGIVSVLYGVFTPKNKHIGLLLDYYFSSWKNTYNYLNPLVQKGAKNTMNIGNDDFLNGAAIPLPTSEMEQQKIASFLSALDDKIAQTSLQIEKMQLWKKGLLQQMFV